MGDDMDIGGAPSSAVQDFLKETSLYLAPDPEIMNNHGLEPRTAYEDQCIGKEGRSRPP